MHSNDNSVTLRQVTRWHRHGYLSLNRINLDVKKGERVLIYSSEKSVLNDLFKILSGIEAADEGDVIINGKLSCVPEAFPLLDDMSVIEYLALPLILEGSSQKAAFETASAFAGEYPIAEKLSIKAQYLTPLERHILMLLMALINQPDVLLIEDCAHTLNAADEKIFWTWVEQLTQKQPVTLIGMSVHKDIPMKLHIYSMGDDIRA